jgi:hypothetical protein
VQFVHGRELHDLLRRSRLWAGHFDSDDSTFESGSHKYPQAVNRVRDVHVAPLDKVRSLTDQLL